MPTIHMIGSSIEDELEEEKFAVFLALCTRLGVTEVIASGTSDPEHFYAVGHGIVVDFWTGTRTAEKVSHRLKKAGIEVLPYAGRVMLDFEHELEELEESVKEIARNAAGRYLLACPKCYRAVGNAKYCPYCGAKCDSHLLWCAKCKMGYRPSFAHCTHCGGFLEPTGEWVFNYYHPEDIFDGVYLTEEEANKPPDDDYNL